MNVDRTESVYGAFGVGKHVRAFPNPEGPAVQGVLRCMSATLVCGQSLTSHLGSVAFCTASSAHSVTLCHVITDLPALVNCRLCVLLDLISRRTNPSPSSRFHALGMERVKRQDQPAPAAGLLGRRFE